MLALYIILPISVIKLRYKLPVEERVAFAKPGTWATK